MNFRALFTLLLIVITATLLAQPLNFTCETAELDRPLDPAFLQPVPESQTPCFSQFFEVDYEIIENLGLIGAQSRVNDILQKSVLLWAQDGILMDYEVHYWNTPSPYSGNSTGQWLQSFGDNRLPNDADVQHLLIWEGGGGIAYVNQLGDNMNYCVSGIYDSEQDWPFYSWNPMVVTHEAGHVVGSPHTHNCGWPGGALDSCPGYTEGNCLLPGPPDGNQGTVMSYCHLSQWGINFLLGFHPTVETLLKNKLIAHNSPCTVDPPPPPPPTDDCDDYQVYIDVTPDAYPGEVSYLIIDEQANTVASGGPWDKNQAFLPQLDTLCLPEGCYYFEIVDQDGLTGTLCGDGYFQISTNDEIVGAGADFAGSLGVSFCLGEQISCEVPDYDGLEPYSNQDMGEMTIEGENLHMQGNTWKAKYYPYEVTPNTVVELDIKIVSEGEIHAIGLVDNTQSLSPQLTIRLAGTQNWFGNGAMDDDIVVSGYRHYEIPLGQLYALEEDALGVMDYLLFVNDHDVFPATAESYIKNLVICEVPDDELPLLPLNTQATQRNKRNIYDTPAVARSLPYPNPVQGYLHLPYPTKYELVDALGQIVLSGDKTPINVGQLAKGFYFIRYAGDQHKIIVQ